MAKKVTKKKSKKKVKEPKSPHYIRLEGVNSKWLNKKSKESKVPMATLVDMLIKLERKRESINEPSLQFS